MTVVVKVTAQCSAGKVAKVDIVGAPGEPHTSETLADGESATYSVYASRRVIFTEADAPAGAEDLKKADAAPTGEAPQPE